MDLEGCEMSFTARLGRRERTTSSARPWLLFLVVGLLTALLAFPIYAAKGGNGKGGPKDKQDTGGGGSQAVPEQHFLWRVPLAGPYSGVRPVVSADGTIYAVDVFDNLFAVSPHGQVKWSQGQAGSKGVDVGPDGTVYTGNENWIKAFTPEGQLKWTYTQAPRAFVMQDVAVGPDGNIYAIASSGMGVFSLTPDGELRWTNAEAYSRPFIGYAEFAFGPTANGSDHQLYFYANGHTRAVRLSDGASVFLTGGNQDPQVSPLDGTWHTGDSAYSPDGTLIWLFQYEPFTGAREPSMGKSGTHYSVNQSRTVYAIDSVGVANWSQTMNEYVASPGVDPAESQILLSAGGSFVPVAIKSVSTANGSELWRMEFPANPDGLNPDELDQYIDTQVAYNDDGSAAYVVTALAGGFVSYLNAINTDTSIPSASTVLRAVDIKLDAQSKRHSVSMRGVVTVLDENLAPVSGATVNAIWTLPGGSTAAVSASTNGSGEARFSESGDGGLYWLEVTDISLAGYTFDPKHSMLVAGKAWF
jgi:hypothetical protein